VKRIAIALMLLAAAASASAQDAPQSDAPQSFDDLSARAQQAYEANRPDEAAQLYADAVKMRPDWTQGWWALGMISYQQDRYPECRDALTHMVAQDASAAPGWALLGLCEFSTKQYDLSFQHLKKGHMLVPVREGGGPLLDMADYHLALLLTRQGAFEVAQEVLVRVALKVRDHPEMYVGAGLASLRIALLPSELPAKQKDVVTMAGKTFWDLVSQPPPEAEADFKALVTKYPKTPNVHYYYGTYLASHHPEKCAQEFLQELRVTPDSVPARVQLVLRYIVDGKLVPALRYAREAVALSPESVGAQLALAETLRAQGNDERALAAFLEARRLDPVSPKIRLYLVNEYRALGRIDDIRKEQSEYERLKAEQQNWP
jgi:tetratricopeptide (TPR) repeat protein